MTTKLENQQSSFSGIIGLAQPDDIQPLSDAKAGEVASPRLTSPRPAGIPHDIIPNPGSNRFNDKRDDALIASGTHYFCRGHLRAVPVETQSNNPAYCKNCLAVIEGERRNKDVDTWAGEIFIHHNKRHTIHAAKNSKETLTEIKTFCLGDVKPQVPSEKITTSLLQPIKPTARSRTTNPDIVTVNSGRKCIICQKVITWGNSRVKYCSDPCQKKAHFIRKAVTS
jgi:hypothetical protein